MITVNSLSGGKTSSYIAMNYPAELDIFALVCIEDHNANGGFWRKNRKIQQLVNDKLNKHCPEFGEFKATAEDPKTVVAMIELEQMIGREITWVRGTSFDNLIQYERKAIPNVGMRWCTYEMKIKPIFEFLFVRDMLPCEMRIGFRHDEQERKDDFNEYYDFHYASEYIKHKGFPKKAKTAGRWQRMIDRIHWRIGSFPLIEDKVIHYTIQEYWKNHNIDWPKDSNCQCCFWKDPQQLRRNFDTNLGIMAWAGVMEVIMKRRWKRDIGMFTCGKIGIQQDFFGGAGSGCSADGMCTS